jgi:hypothetical protein
MRMSEMTVLIQVRARHDDAGQALIQRMQAAMPPQMKSVTGSLPDGREQPRFPNTLLMKSKAPVGNAKQTREIATDYFRTDPRQMSVNYAALTPATGTFEATSYSPDAPPEDVVLLRGDRDDLSWWEMVAQATDPTVARHLIGERPGA